MLETVFKKVPAATPFYTLSGTAEGTSNDAVDY